MALIALIFGVRLKVYRSDYCAIDSYIYYYFILK